MMVAGRPAAMVSILGNPGRVLAEKLLIMKITSAISGKI